MTTKLSDIQLILLTGAVQRDDGSLLPPPDSVGSQAGRIAKTVTALLKRDLAEEYDAIDPTRVWREEGDRRIGVRITAQGRAAIGIEDAEHGTPPVAPTPEPTIQRPATKQALVIGMLKRRGGASITDLTQATSWLPHTTRAALTGLRKKGHAITNDKVDGITRYHIAEAA